MRRVLSLLGTVLFLLVVAIPGAQAVSTPGAFDEQQGSTRFAETVPSPTDSPTPVPEPQPPIAPIPSDPPPVEPPPVEQPPVEPPPVEQPPVEQPQPPGNQIDPATGFQIDPFTGFLIHPGTGYLIEPDTGRLLVYAVDGTLVSSGFVWDASTGLVTEEATETPTETPSPEPTPTETPSPSASPSVTATPSASPSPSETSVTASNSENSGGFDSQTWIRIGVIVLLVALGVAFYIRLKRAGGRPLSRIPHESK